MAMCEGAANDATMPNDATIHGQQRLWLNHVLASTGDTASSLARRAGVSTTTLTRFFQDNVGVTTLSARTIARIEEATGHRFSEFQSGGLSEPTVRRFATSDEASTDDAASAAIRAAIGQQGNSRTPWLIADDSLAALGILAGDVIVIDESDPPRDGDVVLVQVADRASGEARTEFRALHGQMLHGGAIGGRQKPLVHDGEWNRVCGRMVALVRPPSSQNGTPPAN